MFSVKCKVHIYIPFMYIHFSLQNVNSTFGSFTYLDFKVNFFV